MSYKIKDLDKGFEDFIVTDLKGIQTYIIDLENDKDFDIATIDTFEKAKKFLNDEYNIDIEMV